MSAHAARTALAANPVPAPQKTKGFLRIVRHGAGPSAIYIITYHKLDAEGVLPRPAMAEGAEALIDLLEKIGVDFRVSEVRGALEDILRFGSANIPDLWLSDEEMVEKGLVEA
ncbi:MAG TPA: hypothetical protein VKT53_04545 [Candidatus Acidoferrum sp.]|nr:hypothetical protein [Candidatus Acidoferrum sp.]